MSHKQLTNEPGETRASVRGARRQSVAAVEKPVSTSWWLYVLRCGDCSLYTGIARDVARRLAMHERGRGARYTRGRLPLEILGQWACEDHGTALRAERAFKKLSRARKDALVRVGMADFVRRFV